MANHEGIDLLDEVRSHLLKIAKDGIDDAGLIEKIDRFKRNFFLNKPRLVWSISDGGRREKSKFRNYKLYAWIEDACYNPYYRYLVTKNDELLMMDDERSMEDAKQSAEKVIYGEIS
jgi:hypothetical protein